MVFDSSVVRSCVPIASTSSVRLATPRVDNPVRGALQLVAIAVLVVFLAELPAGEGARGPLNRLVSTCLLAHLALFVVSLAYHCVPWPPISKARMQRIDHSMIYVKIAGSVGPFAWLTFAPSHAVLLIAAAWLIALVGITQKIFFPGVPPRHSSYVQVGQAALLVPCFTDLVGRDVAGTGPALALAAACYTLGGIVFLLERPNPWPSRYAFHELFHTLLLIGGCAVGRSLLHLVRESV